MPLTAFSKTYRKELDVAQVLDMLSQRDGIVGTVSVAEIPDHWREFIRDDFECPCCFVTGAEVVKEAISRSTGRPVRQPCFRFLTPGHHAHCDFAMDANLNSQPENLVSFGAQNSKLTRAVRDLVCTGIQLNIFDQVTIRNMRQWFFLRKMDSMFLVTLDPILPKWLHGLRRAVAFSYGSLPHGVSLCAEIARMPGFDWRLEASRQLHSRYVDVLNVLQQERMWLPDGDRIALLAARNRGKEVFDPLALENEYEKSVSLATFISRNYAPIHALGHEKGVAVAVLALSALLLFTCEWSLHKATSIFAAIATSVGSADQSLGNVMGLNPFHDYEAWRTLKRLQELGIAVPENSDAKLELGGIEQDLRSKFQASL